MPSTNRVPPSGSAAALLALIVLAIAALPAAAGGDTSPASKAQPCSDVVVQFEPEGSGGATEIKAKNIGCPKARKVVRACILGELRPGWGAVFDDPKFVLSKDDRRIRYLAVGGGGCVPV